MGKELWTVEVNLSDDVTNSCAYHISELERTVEINRLAAYKAQKRDAWVLVGIAESHEAAHVMCSKIHEKACFTQGKHPKFLEDKLYELEEKNKEQNEDH